MGAFALRERRSPRAARWQLCARWIPAIVAIAANCTFAAESASGRRYELSGAGTLSLDAPLQQRDGLRLRATLSPDAAVIDTLVLQSGGRFALTANLAAQSALVCYNDTIFRDDFDGDGF